MLRVEKLKSILWKFSLLEDISFELPANTCLAILGLNGAGKSTLAKSLIGINPIVSGSIEIAGTEISKMTSNQRVHLGLGYVPQGREIFSDLSVRRES